MTTVTVGARMAPREYAVIAVMMDVERPTTSEITRYAYRRFIGMSHTEARASILSERKTVASTDTQDRMIAVRLPDDLVEAAHSIIPGDEIATKHRYILARATTDDEQEATALATRKIGRPRKQPAS